MNHFIENKDISHLSNFRTPAKTRYYFAVHSRQDVDKIYKSIQWILSQKLPYIFVTGGTNSLFAFDQYPGLVIHIQLKGWNYNEKNQLLTTAAAESIWEIASSLEKEYRQDIWHRFIGLPGSIAGAVYGNAGCFGLETQGNFLEVEVLNIETGKKEIFKKEEMSFTYRSSKLKQEKKYCIIEASFDLSQKVEKYSSDIDNIYFREEVQPKGYSCGSFFKNPKVDRDMFCLQNTSLQESCPKQISAGYLIEQVGLKGEQKGGAYFSEKHANFLMHNGQGTYKDVLDLYTLAQLRVQERFGISLESEVQIIYPHI